MRWPSAVLARWPPAVLARWPPAHRITALSVPRRHCSALSPRVRAQREEQALAALHATPGLDPALATVAGVVVNPTGDVACQLEFFSAACPQRSAIEEAARSAIMECGWATDCSVSAHVRQPTSFLGAKSPASLQHVGALLGVSSCKGGVGKSTIAANVAFALAELGARVGLLDADVHGPSLPSLVALPDDTLPLLQRADNRLLRPPLVHGVKLMSYGFIAKGASTGRVPAAVMRGPMVGKVVGQMLSGTEWGELDYLLVDLPPGTGDVQLTLCQSFGLTAALVITTPQKLARVDVEKGVDMFRELGVPIVSLVENMAYFKVRGGRGPMEPDREGRDRWGPTGGVRWNPIRPRAPACDHCLGRTPTATRTTRSARRSSRQCASTRGCRRTTPSACPSSPTSPLLATTPPLSCSPGATVRRLASYAPWPRGLPSRSHGCSGLVAACRRSYSSIRSAVS